ncbi:MAG: beta-mannosidase [Ruminiclostridium sp.]|nr:beta-mannosidase [Ruminiclostridium sp.]
MYVCELKKEWKLRYEPLYYDREYYAEVAEKKDGWVNVEALPCDVHVPLIENGMIEDPVIADNCFNCEWIEDKSWWFRKVFKAEKELLHSHNSELVVERLDAEADLFLNGVYLGHHKSETYPFRKDIRDILHEGENILVIRLTAGLEYYNELGLSRIHWKGSDYVSGSFIRNCGPRRDHRRVFVRKPQYVFGWDWNPRIGTCGIMGDARIESYNDIAIRSVKFTTRNLMDREAQISVETEIENLYSITTIDAAARLDVCFNDATVCSIEKEIFMTSGLNYVNFEFNIDNPMLWWPNGMGEQNLYTIKIYAASSTGGTDYHELKTGIRTVKLNTDKISNSSRLFALEINGVKTFCKGGNWETPDSIYGRIADEKYEKLIKEAKEANFNMLRFNGVGAYERDYFYECCNRYGILIWQDFTFSCAAYPDELDWFRYEVEKEVDYQTRRLRNHPCVVLWCGNNECQITLESYGKISYLEDKKPAFPRGILLFNEIMPRLARKNSPDIPYWNSSPFGGIDLNSDEYGDRHPWGESFMNEDINKRIALEEYNKVRGRFVSEFGCIGPTKKSSLYKYYGSENVVIGGGTWNLHTNEFEKETINAAILKHYVDPESLSLDEYLLYAGLFQGLMLGYAFELLRYAENNYGALVWSYNDCWGEVGWSIIDYYAIRKISFYFVKRALAHTKLIMREDGKAINIICMNDTPKTLKFELEYGYMTFGGTKEDTASRTVTIKPFTKAVVAAQMKKGPHDTSKGLYYASADSNCSLIPAILRTCDFRNMQITLPEIKVTGLKECGGEINFTVSSDKYVHAVHFGLNDDVLLSDEYFDLLPGESRKVTVQCVNHPIATGDIIPRYVYVR